MAGAVHATDCRTPTTGDTTGAQAAPRVGIPLAFEREANRRLGDGGRHCLRQQPARPATRSQRPCGRVSAAPDTLHGAMAAALGDITSRRIALCSVADTLQTRSSFANPWESPGLPCRVTCHNQGPEAHPSGHGSAPPPIGPPLSPGASSPSMRRIDAGAAGGATACHMYLQPGAVVGSEPGRRPSFRGGNPVQAIATSPLRGSRLVGCRPFTCVQTHNSESASATCNSESTGRPDPYQVPDVPAPVDCNSYRPRGNAAPTCQPLPTACIRAALPGTAQAWLCGKPFCQERE